MVWNTIIDVDNLNELLALLFCHVYEIYFIELFQINCFWPGTKIFISDILKITTNFYFKI